MKTLFEEIKVKKDYVNHNNLLQPKTGVLFTDFISQTVAKKSKRMGSSYSSNYTTLLFHIYNFIELNNVIIYTNSVGEEFLDDFILYLESLELKQTYIKNIVTLAKAMARKAALYGYAVYSSYDDVVIDGEDSFSVYLSMNEITRIYYFKGLTKKQAEIRDLFVVGCLTALRYLDYSILTKQNFDGKFITKVTKKTNKKVIIPLHEYVREIYDRYDGEISKNLSIQHFNRYLKKICQKVGFTEPINYSYTKGGKMVTETKEKWELISSHTARRSAATNMFLTGRMKTYEIMQVTGHTTEKSFFRYIKQTTQNTANQIAGDGYFRI